MKFLIDSALSPVVAEGLRALGMTRFTSEFRNLHETLTKLAKQAPIKMVGLFITYD